MYDSVISKPVPNELGFALAERMSSMVRIATDPLRPMFDLVKCLASEKVCQYPSLLITSAYEQNFASMRLNYTYCNDQQGSDAEFNVVWNTYEELVKKFSTLRAMHMRVNASSDIVDGRKVKLLAALREAHRQKLRSHVKCVNEATRQYYLVCCLSGGLVKTVSSWQQLIEEWPDSKGDRYEELSREAVKLKCSMEDAVIQLSEINALRLQFLLQLSITDIKCTNAKATGDIPTLKPPPPPDATMSSNSETMS